MIFVKRRYDLKEAAIVIETQAKKKIVSVCPSHCLWMSEKVCVRISLCCGARYSCIAEVEATCDQIIFCGSYKRY